MSTVTKTAMGAMVEQVTITLDKEDYLPLYREELEKIRQKANLKGFRKGKVPVSLMVKMYGKGVLGEVVSRLLGQELEMVMRGDGPDDYLGSPIPVGEQPDFTGDTAAQESYSMTFELGCAPSFELAGTDESSSYTIYDVQVPAEAVQETMKRIISERGELQEHEGAIGEEDLLRLSVRELDGDAVKEGGVESSFRVSVDRLVPGALKTEIMGLAKGDVFRCNIYELEQDQTPEQVNKYLLGLEEDEPDGADPVVGPHFEATIEGVSRKVVPEMTEASWAEAFGPDVRTEEAAVAEVERWLKSQESNLVDYLFLHAFREQILSLNREAMSLPEEFMLRWIRQEDEAEAEKAEADPATFYDEIRWSIIRSRLINRFGIEVTEKDIRQQAVNRVAGYLGGYAQPEFVSRLVQNILSNKEQVQSLASEVEQNRFIKALQTQLTLHREPIGKEALQEKYEAVQKSKLPPPAEPTEMVEDIEVTGVEITTE